MPYSMRRLISKLTLVFILASSFLKRGGVLLKLFYYRVGLGSSKDVSGAGPPLPMEECAMPLENPPPIVYTIAIPKLP